MTIERDKEELDTLVSRTYRELPTPRAPDHLNQSILRMAANKSQGKGNFLFAAWIKPVTLAATMGLSLAILLEMSEVQTTAEQMELVPTTVESQVESVREEFTPQETDSLEQAENRARSEIEQDPVSIREDEPASTEEGFVEEPVLEDVDLRKREAKGKVDSFAASAPAAARPAARKLAADLPDSNQPVAEQRLVTTEPVASFGLSTEIKDSDAEAACDERVRQSADTWLECIDELRKSGATLDADREYEAFILEYPAESANSESNK